MEYIGIDLGSQRCVVARPSGEIVLNELGGMTTATLVSFKDKERLIGEAAVLASSTNPTNTVDHINMFLGKSHAEVLEQMATFPCPRAAYVMNQAGQAAAAVSYNDAEQHFTPVQLLAMVLGKLGSNVKNTPLANIRAGIAVPSGWGNAEKEAILEAAKVAGFGASGVLTRDAALARCFHRKHPIKEDGEAKTIMIVDVGHATTSAAIVRLDAAGETVVAQTYNGKLGSVNFDKAVFEHFQAKLKASHGLDIQGHSRQGRRLLAACEQLKKLLSTIPEAVVQVENLGNDCDLSLSLTKTEFDALSVTHTAALETLLAALLADARVAGADLASVEIVGGGTRQPAVQAAISKTVGRDGLLGRMLDSATAVAVGAAAAEELLEAQTVVVADALVALESAMRAQDEANHLLANKRNEIETFVYEIRGKASQKHGHLIDYAVVNPFLDAAEDWFYSEEAEQATLEEATTRVAALKADITAACTTYFAAVAKDEQALEAHLEAEAQKAALEHKEDDDHDFRKLKTPDRMRLVMKNKDEGNELFRGGNVQHAAARYVKALTHASKFFDLRPEEADEVKAVKLSLYLNLAQCYLKMEAFAKAVSNCKDALDLDATNTKALYRRAIAYEKLKDYESAHRDITEAFRLTPDDRAVVVCHERLKVYMKKQAEKEKRMWSKAFA
ncbi:hsp70-like protein [Achlya hypogyna]|uniref:Hsp70-like protein n=1 Tax=Achlya hypogyna TaxID=1202772 RepID=A0A1V9YBD4_ACHHY|nr:hsp70-like protein [Achlya hypogyna]